MKRKGGKSARQCLPFLLACLGFIILLGICTLVLVQRKDRVSLDEARIVASVNGEPVVYGEFLLALQKERAQVFAYFQSKYGAEDQPDFWDRSYGGEGEVPMAMAKAAAMQKLVRLKAEQGLFRDYGLLPDPGYPAFLQELKRENLRRATEAKAGRPVYGPRQYEAGVFYEIRQSNLMEGLKRKLADTGKLEVADSEIEAYYSAHREDFVRSGAVRVLKLSLPAGEKGEEESFLEQMKPRLLEASGLAELAGVCGGAAAGGYACEEVSLSSESSRSDAMMQPVLASAGSLLQPGEISGIFTENGYWTILKCLSREKDTVVPIAEVKDRIRKVIMDSKFEQLLKQEAAAAQVETDRLIMDAISGRVLD